MGILNVTADSFSDGGRYEDPRAALKHGLEMAEQGADVIDIGGESTRPGAERQPAEAQLRRILPVIGPLRERLPERVRISVDTTLAGVAAAALDAGAAIINDVSAGRDDGDMFALAAARQVPMVLMHMQGIPASMQRNPVYTDVVEEVRSFLLERAAVAEQAGIRRENLILDPGIGFGKTREHNLQLLAGLPRLVESGYLVLLGASRKRFMAAVCGVDDYALLAGATCATTTLGVMAGVGIFRVHDVRENRQAADLAYALQGRVRRD